MPSLFIHTYVRLKFFCYVLQVIHQDNDSSVQIPITQLTELGMQPFLPNFMVMYCSSVAICKLVFNFLFGNGKYFTFCHYIR